MHWNIQVLRIILPCKQVILKTKKYPSMPLETVNKQKKNKESESLQEMYVAHLRFMFLCSTIQSSSICTFAINIFSKLSFSSVVIYWNF